MSSKTRELLSKKQVELGWVEEVSCRTKRPISIDAQSDMRAECGDAGLFCRPELRQSMPSRSNSPVQKGPIALQNQ